MSKFRLLQDFVGVTVSFRWLGVSRQVEDGVVDPLANILHVDRNYLVLKKQIFDTSNEPYRRLSTLRSQIRQYWFRQTLPSLDRGVRLIHRSKVNEFIEKMKEFQEKWTVAVQELDRIWDQLLKDLQLKLGTLFNPGDYPGRPVDLFRFRWDFSSVSFPEQLLREGLREEYERFQQKLDATLVAIKHSFLEELNGLVTHLIERLTPDPLTQERKRFKNSTVENLREFFQRFRELNVTDDAELANLIQTAEQILAGVDADQLRDNDALAQKVRDNLKQVAEQLQQEQVLTSEKLRKLWI